MDAVILALAALVLVVAAGAGVALVLLDRPGTLAMLGFVVLFAVFDGFLRPGDESQPAVRMIGGGALFLLTALFLLGEGIEVAARSQAGGESGQRPRAVTALLIGTLVGAVLGLIFIDPLLGGMLIGAVTGGAAGWALANREKSGHRVGRQWAAAAKLAVALVMWLTVGAAVLWP